MRIWLKNHTLKGWAMGETKISEDFNRRWNANRAEFWTSVARIWGNLMVTATVNIDLVSHGEQGKAPMWSTFNARSKGKAFT
jgi:hypothetical protein